MNNNCLIYYWILKFRGDEEDSAIIMMSLQDKKNLNNKDNKGKASNEITENKVWFIIKLS